MPMSKNSDMFVFCWSLALILWECGLLHMSSNFLSSWIKIINTLIQEPYSKWSKLIGYHINMSLLKGQSKSRYFSKIVTGVIQNLHSI